MFQRSVPAVLLIDFDNVEKYGLADKIPNWTAWIEDVNFDESGRRRRLLQKRVYWNSQFESYRDAFEANGFDVVMCPSRLRKGKSAVDMIMALDAFQVATGDKKVAEFILLTTDSDFIPLFERLAELSKSIVALADTEQKFVFSTYSDHADIVIPTFRIREAGKYTRQRVGLFGLIRRPASAEATATPASRGAQRPSPREPSDPVMVSQAPKRAGNLEAAAQLVAAVAKQSSGSDISKQTITRALERKFDSVAQSKWFGCGDYKSFINKVASTDEDEWSKCASRPRRRRWPPAPGQRSMPRPWPRC
jgi:uncharacterized LabA/DUF88 family protein